MLSQADSNSTMDGAAFGRSRRPSFHCRLLIEKVVWQLLPMSVSNRKSAIPAILGEAMIVENLRHTRRR